MIYEILQATEGNFAVIATLKVEDGVMVETTVFDPTPPVRDALAQAENGQLTARTGGGENGLKYEKVEAVQPGDAGFADALQEMLPGNLIVREA